MNYPVDTPMRLRAVLRALRRSRSLTQEQTGKLLGVNQRRAAKIEGNPGVTSFGQVSRLVSALGGRLVMEVREADGTAPQPAAGAKKRAPAQTTARTGKSVKTVTTQSRGEW